MSDHSCDYYCQKEECIRAQRDELRQRLEASVNTYYYSGWNSALELASHLLQHEFKQAFGEDTLASIAVYVKGLKKCD